ncbi:DUF4082 domain-containing protein [Embleya sp. NPDC005971]|uniref:DUF4082 domain-containing protein n=1 Tax=Embleya sp. NPDC005971 TaxID=3156724 RepID=UPI0033FE8FC9
MADYRIWPATSGAVTDEATAPINLGTEFSLSATGWVKALHFWRATLAEAGPVTGAVYDVATGTQVAGTAVTYSLSGTGWHTATLGVAVQLTASTRYIVVVHHTDRYGGTGGYWAGGGPGASGITNGILTAPAAAAVTSAPLGNGRYEETGSIGAPTNTFNGGNYWADLTVSDVNPGGTDYTANPVDPVGLTDSTNTAFTADRSATDPVGLHDQAAAVLDTTRILADPVGLLDAATSVLDLARTATDSVGLTDTSGAVLDLTRAPTDPIGLTDSTAALLDSTRAVADLVGITDSVIVVLGRQLEVTIVDTIGLTDEAIATSGAPSAPPRYAVGEPTTTWTCGPPLT